MAFDGEGSASRVYDVRLEGEFVDSWPITASGVALHDSQVELEVPLRLIDATLAFRHVEVIHPGWAEYVPRDADGLWHADCGIDGCVAVEGPTEVTESVIGTGQRERAGVRWLQSSGDHAILDTTVYTRDPAAGWMEVPFELPASVYDLHNDRVLLHTPDEGIAVASFRSALAGGPVWELTHTIIRPDGMPWQLQRARLGDDDLLVAIDYEDGGELAAYLYEVPPGEEAMHRATLALPALFGGLSGAVLSDEVILLWGSAHIPGSVDTFLGWVSDEGSWNLAFEDQEFLANWYDDGPMVVRPMGLEVFLRYRGQSLDVYSIDPTTPDLLTFVRSVPMPYPSEAVQLEGRRLAIGTSQDSAAGEVYVYPDVLSGVPPVVVRRADRLHGEALGERCGWAGLELLCDVAYEDGIVSFLPASGAW